MTKPSVSETFKRFLNSEQIGGTVLIASTLIALSLANSPLGEQFAGIWKHRIGTLTLAQWINDGLMAIFFLLIGLELERELYVGELSRIEDALFPIIAALGGMIGPALIYLYFNSGLETQAGFGIPMATDIAFAIGVLALLGTRIPIALKIFVVAFAVIDDLGAIIVIATFYTSNLDLGTLAGAGIAFGFLVTLNRLNVMALSAYILGGIVMWLLILRSGIHPTLAGVLLAFAVPFTSRSKEFESPSHKLENCLHKPVAFVVLPLFALANTGVVVQSDWYQQLGTPNTLGIIAGLMLGKPLGITLFCLVAVGLGVCRLPNGVRWHHIVGAGILGGIGFTMSIFITNLAFAGNPAVISTSKMAVLSASLGAGIVAFVWLRFVGQSKAAQFTG
jgi:NhaA family Na+:H+ antiporter